MNLNTSIGEAGGKNNIIRNKFVYLVHHLTSKSVIIPILLLLVLGLFLENYSFKNSQSKALVSYLDSGSCDKLERGYKIDLATCKDDLERRLQISKATQNEIDDLRDRTNYTSSSKRCNKKEDIWSHLDENLKKKTYKEDVISPGQSAYDIIPFAWSDDCNKIPFVLELVGRDGGAYKDEDFSFRGLYLYSDVDKKINIILTLERNSYIDEVEYESNFWFNKDYIFIVDTYENKSILIKKKYDYDSNTEKISPEEF